MWRAIKIIYRQGGRFFTREWLNILEATIIIFYLVAIALLYNTDIDVGISSSPPLARQFNLKFSALSRGRGKKILTQAIPSYVQVLSHIFELSIISLLSTCTCAKIHLLPWNGFLICSLMITLFYNCVSNNYTHGPCTIIIIQMQVYLLQIIY